MFTIKYRAFNHDDAQPGTYFPNEQIHGPFVFVSQEYDKGSQVVIAVPPGDGESTRFGPAMRSAAHPEAPTPIVWVMNEGGATVATYHL